MDAYGEYVLATDVRRAVETTVRTWQRDYLEQVGARQGYTPGQLPQFRSFPARFDFDKNPEDQLPSCVIVASSVGDLDRRGDGHYRGNWAIAVGCVASANDYDATYKLCETYTAAVRLILVQHGSLGGIASGMQWQGERYDALTVENMPSLVAGTVQAVVTIDQLVNAMMGLQLPTSPDDDVPVQPQLDTIESTLVTIDRKDV